MRQSDLITVINKRYMQEKQGLLMSKEYCIWVIIDMLCLTGQESAQ